MAAVCHLLMLGDGTNSIYIFVGTLNWVFFSVLLSIVIFFYYKSKCLSNATVCPCRIRFSRDSRTGLSFLSLQIKFKICGS